MTDHTIKSSKHFLTESNNGKKIALATFLSEYRRVAGVIVDDMWDNGYQFNVRGNDYTFHPKQNKLDVPTFIDYKDFEVDTTLTARAMSSLVVQLAGVLGASVEKQRKRLFFLDKAKKDGTPKSKLKSLIKRIKQNIPQKPNVSRINPELSSKCCCFVPTVGEFSGFIKLSAYLKGHQATYLPIRFHSHSNKFAGMGGTMLTSFLITDKYINIRWKIPVAVKKTTGNTVGVDQGVKTAITLSDGQFSSGDVHGHTLDSIMVKMSRKQKGSNAFRRAQDHRKNHINMVMNRIDFSNIKEIRLEEIRNIGYSNPRSRFLSHFTNTIIRDKLEDVATQNGVHFVQQSSTYRSQRCSSCGLVRKANRKGKIYECNHCGNVMDADYNAACNHAIDLPDVPYTLRMKNHNRGNGFFWKPTGFYDFSGGSLESPPPVKDK